ncbi:hypothetical protein UPYG_G00229090 [Umbra pygmaea]|uniref:Saposin B-type domain-containing protein n=1 Tax=Umbra pygmaea TaxID=75934 RepID=A0ABD0WD15_UMBPY
MKTSLLLLALCLLACSVWAVSGQCPDNDLDDLVLEDEIQPGELMKQQLMGTCWACKWALNKVKNAIGKGSSNDQVKGKLLSVCDQIGFVKSLCKSLVKKHLWVLVEELSTTDDVRTICVNIKACKPKELLDLSY